MTRSETVLAHKDMRCVGEIDGFPLVTSPGCESGKVHFWRTGLFMAFRGYEDVPFCVVGRDEDALRAADSQGVLAKMLHEARSKGLLDDEN